MKPIKTTCINCQQPILMIKGATKTRRADPRPETFVFDAKSEERFITDAGDVVTGTAIRAGHSEQHHDVLTGYRLHKCETKGA